MKEREARKGHQAALGKATQSLGPRGSRTDLSVHSEGNLEGSDVFGRAGYENSNPQVVKEGRKEGNLPEMEGGQGAVT